MFEIPLQVIDDDEIEQPIVIHVNPGSGDGPKPSKLRIGFVEAGFGGDIREGPVSVVVIERVAIHAGDKNVLISIVVVVADSHAGVVAGPEKPGFFGYVGEVSLAIVLEQAVVVFRRKSFEAF